MEQIFEEMVKRWPSAVVARTEVRKFSGGLLSERYLANLDSQGLGPAGRFLCGRKVGYGAAALAGWLEARSNKVPPR